MTWPVSEIHTDGSTAAYPSTLYILAVFSLSSRLIVLVQTLQRSPNAKKTNLFKFIIRNEKYLVELKAKGASQYLRGVIIISNNICLPVINNNKIKKDLPLRGN